MTVRLWLGILSLILVAAVAAAGVVTFAKHKPHHDPCSQASGTTNPYLNAIGDISCGNQP